MDSSRRFTFSVRSTLFNFRLSRGSSVSTMIVTGRSNPGLRSRQGTPKLEDAEIAVQKKNRCCHRLYGGPIGARKGLAGQNPRR